MLKIKKLSGGYNKKTVFENISFELGRGEILNVLGKNGVGKTTLFKTILNFLKPYKGEVIVANKKLHKLSQKEIAKLIAYVPQSHNPAFPFKVQDVILMGRTPHLSNFSTPKNQDVMRVKEIMIDLGIIHLENKLYTEISGGERQMVLIARAMAQEPNILIMDEPTSNLDFGNQIKIIKVIKKLSESGVTIIMISHFPNHAFLCSGKVAIMSNNENFEIGEAKDIITDINMKEVYGIDTFIKQDEYQGREINFCFPIM